MLRSNRRYFLTTALATGAAALPGLGWAQTYPNSPIRLLVGFAPGGPTDILARIVATAMTQVLGQTVVVDNRPGAAGAIATRNLASADADGYTLMFSGDGQLTLLPQLSANAGYDTLKDIAPLRTLVGQSNALLVNKASGITDLASLIRMAKAKPGQLRFASAGNGTPSHLVGVLLENATGIELLHVPYKGAGPAMTDFLGGRIDMMFVGMPVAVRHANNDQLSAIAVTGIKRAPLLAATPTFTELGIPGLGESTDVWWAVVAPSATPAAVRQRLEAALNTVLSDPKLQQAFQMQGVDIVNRDANATVQRIQSDHARWARLIKSGKVARI